MKQARAIARMMTLLGLLSAGAAIGQTISSAVGSYATITTFDVAHGSNPSAPLTQTASGRLVGTTHSGGDYNMGTVVQIDPASGKARVLHSFIQDGRETLANGAQ